MSQATEIANNDQAGADAGDLPGMKSEHGSVEPMVNQPSEWEALLERLKTGGPHAPSLWYRLIDMAELSGDREKIVASYDALLAAYPNTVRGITSAQPYTAS
jgi:hypothetical protein